jgi:DNA-binding winged helix-turn-helix (wHTH) protein
MRHILGQPLRQMLLAGINVYEDKKIPKLEKAEANVWELFHYLKTAPDNLVNLVPGNDRLSLLRALGQAAEQARSRDGLLFVFSGYAAIAGEKVYLIPSDAGSDWMLPDTAIPLQRVGEILRGAAKSALLLDVVALPGMVSGVDAPRRLAEAMISTLPDIPMLVCVALTESSEFTQAVLEKITQAEGDLTLAELAEHATAVVKVSPVNKKLEMVCATHKGENILLWRKGVIEEKAPSFVRETNPIDEVFPIPVRLTEHFCNRSEEINRVRDVLQQTTVKPVVIKGGRCVGKTSFINRIKLLLGEEDYQLRFLYFSIEPSSFLNWQQFAQEIWDGVQKCARKVKIQFPTEWQGRVEFHSFTQFSNRLEEASTLMKDWVFVVFLDEFDKLAHQCDELEQKRIIGLLRYIVETSNCPMVFIISVLNELPAADSYGSPLSTATLHLKPLDRVCTENLMRSLMEEFYQVSREAVDWVYSFSGGHPFFVKWLLAKVFENFNDRSSPMQVITPEMLEKAARAGDRFSHYAREVLRDVYATYLSDDEHFVLLWLAAHQQTSLLEADLEQMTALRKRARAASASLEEAGYLDRVGEGYHLRIGYISEWLREWADLAAELDRLKILKSSTPGLPEDEGNTLHKQINQQGICIELGTQTVYVEGKPIEGVLTKLEYDTLIFLAGRVNEVVSKDDLANNIYEDHYTGDDQRLHALIYRLRLKLGDIGRSSQYLETLRGRGFRLKNAIFVRMGIQRERGEPE